MVNRNNLIWTNERGTRNFDGRQLDFKLIERQERLQKILERRQAAITDASTSTPTTSGTSTTVTENTTPQPQRRLPRPTRTPRNPRNS